MQYMSIVGRFTRWPTGFLTGFASCTVTVDVTINISGLTLFLLYLCVCMEDQITT